MLSLLFNNVSNRPVIQVIDIPAMEYSKVKNEFWVRCGSPCLQAIQAGGFLLVWSKSLVYVESRPRLHKKRMNFVVCKILDSTVTEASPEAWRTLKPKQMKRMNQAEDLAAGPSC